MNKEEKQQQRKDRQMRIINTLVEQFNEDLDDKNTASTQALDFTIGTINVCVTIYADFIASVGLDKRTARNRCLAELRKTVDRAFNP